MKPTLTLAPLFALALSVLAPASAHAAKQEACEKIENMLLTVQMGAPDLSDANYNAMNESLKAAHQKYCETELPAGFEEAISLVMTYDNGNAIERDGRYFMPDGREFVAQDQSADGILADAISRGANPPILASFTPAHNRCAPGCRYVSWGIWGDARHQAKRSCHNSGEAIDIHAIVCDGRTYPSLSSRFTQYTSCMKNTLGVIYGEGEHRDHAHIELRNCEMCVGLYCHGMREHGGGGQVQHKHRRTRR